MARLVAKRPSYRRHNASDYAVVTLNGEDDCLGPQGTKVRKIA